MKLRPFAEARDYVRTLGLKNQSEWYEYCKSGKKPDDIPSYPHTIYQKKWKGAADWLGTGFLPYEEAREYVHSLGLKNSIQWRNYCKSEEKPDYIPADYYKSSFLMCVCVLL